MGTLLGTIVIVLVAWTKFVTNLVYDRISVPGDRQVPAVTGRFIVSHVPGIKCEGFLSKP